MMCCLDHEIEKKKKKVMTVVAWFFVKVPMCFSDVFRLGMPGFTTCFTVSGDFFFPPFVCTVTWSHRFSVTIYQITWSCFCCSGSCFASLFQEKHPKVPSRILPGMERNISTGPARHRAFGKSNVKSAYSDRCFFCVIYA